jgi:hypothetical protein
MHSLTRDRVRDTEMGNLLCAVGIALILSIRIYSE